MTKISLTVAVAVVAAACSSAPESGPTETTVALDGSTAVVTAPTTTVVVPTTAARLTGTACIVGTWDLDSETFFENVTSAQSDDEVRGEFRYLDGRYRIELTSDGSANEQREDWTFIVSTDFGELVMTVNALARGSYVADDDVLSLDMEQSPSDVEMLIDGTPVDLSEEAATVELPDVSFTNAAYTCSTDVLTVVAEGDVTSIWRRSD